MALPFHSVECASNDRNAKQKGKVVWSEAKKSYFRAADLVNSCHVGRKRCGLAAAEGIVIESQSTMTKWVFPGRFLFPKVRRDFSFKLGLICMYEEYKSFCLYGYLLISNAL